MSMDDILNHLYLERERLLNPPDLEEFTEEDMEGFVKDRLDELWWEEQEKLYQDYERRNQDGKRLVEDI